MMAEPKQAVNQFFQRYTQQPITKDSIVYTTMKFDSGYQCSVKLAIVDGAEFAGELKSNSKDAEKSAAEQVLIHYATEIANLPPSGSSKNKKKKSSGGGGAAALALAVPMVDPVLEAAQQQGLDPNDPMTRSLLEAQLGDSIAQRQKLAQDAACAASGVNSAKSELNALVAKVLRRPMTKLDIVFDSAQVPGGIQATVKMPNLPGQWSEQVWAGEVCRKRPEAEQSAGLMALQTIQADEELMALANRPNEKKMMGFKGGDKGKGKGKGKKGKGKGKGKGKSYGDGGGYDGGVMQNQGGFGGQQNFGGFA